MEDYPSNIARALQNGEIDLGLVPVAIIPSLKEYHIISDYCISCDGEVASVGLYAEKPVEEITEVLLDYQSRTSVQLAQILLREYWKVSPRIIPAHTDFRTCIKGNTAGVVIGDRALEQRKTSAFVYDLGTAWKQFTGLPFVFAAWISNKELPADFIQEFNEANAIGLNALPEVLKDLNNDLIDLEEYYSKNIEYNFTENKRLALDLFLKSIKGNNGQV